MRNAPIIVRRRARPAVNGHHGGSWKVALADFAIAMMAVFMVLWLVEASSPVQKKAIAAYFSKPGVFDSNNSPFPLAFSGSTPQFGPIEAQMSESQTVLSDETLSRPAHNYQEQLFEQLSRELQSDGQLSSYAESFKLQSLPEGIRIDIIEDGKRQMFKRGSDNLDPYFENLLITLTPRLVEINRPLKISGHTDSVPFTENSHKNNWNLSYERAQAALSVLVQGGFPSEQVYKVVAMADRNLLIPEEPENPINRRIELLLLNDKTNSTVPALKAQDVASEVKPEVERMQI